MNLLLSLLLLSWLVAIIIRRRQSKLSHLISKESYARHLATTEMLIYYKSRQEIEQAQEVVESGVNKGSKLVESMHLLLKKIPRNIKKITGKEIPTKAHLNLQNFEDQKVREFYKSLRAQNREIHSILKKFLARKN